MLLSALLIAYFTFTTRQRVPINDVRIHTSAASVAVLPAPKDSKHGSDSLLPASELRIETMRASGAGELKEGSNYGND